MPVRAQRPGYVIAIQSEDLLEAARDADVVVSLLVGPGRYVLEDSVLALVHPPAQAGPQVLDAVRATVEDR